MLKTINNNEKIYTFIIILVMFLFVQKYIIYAMIPITIIAIILIIKNSIKLRKITLLLIAYIIVNIMFILINPSNLFSTSAAIEEIQRGIIYIILYLVISNITISIKHYQKIWIYMLIISFSVQILQFTKIIPINNYLEVLYGQNTVLLITNYNNIQQFRSGSIFIDINPYFKFATGVLLITLNSFIINEVYNKLFYHFIIFASIVSIYLTGSRTAMIISVLLLILYIYYAKNMKISIKSILLINILGIMIIIYSIGFRNNLINISEARLLRISEGIGTSLFFKLNNFYTLISTADYYNIIFGFGPYYNVSDSYRMDADFGYIMAFYGFLGLILIIFIGISILKQVRNDSINNNTMFMYFGFFLIFVNSIITSGVFLNFRVFSMLMLMIFVKKVSKLGG